MDLVILEKYFIGNYWSNTSLIILLSILDLADSHSAEDFCLVCEPTDPCFVREDRMISIVTLMLAWILVNGGATKDNLVRSLFVVRSIILESPFDVSLPELLDNLLNRVLQKPLEREDLLRYESILFEVAIDDFPAVILIYHIHVGSLGSVVRRSHFQRDLIL